MQVRLRYFAMIREIMGQSVESREIPAGSTAGDLFELLAAGEPRLRPLNAATLLMVNQEYVEASHLLRDGDEVAFIPPVSGGSEDESDRFRVTDEPLDARAVESLVVAPDAGAIATFTGTVRDHARGKAVVALNYEAYGPVAEKMLARIGEEIRERWGIERVAIHHRIGYLEPGVASVVIAIASPHRAEAFDACRHAIERIKQIVPIWKKEHYADGAVWVGSEAAYQQEFGRASDPGEPANAADPTGGRSATSADVVTAGRR